MPQDNKNKELKTKEEKESFVSNKVLFIVLAGFSGAIADIMLINSFQALVIQGIWLNVMAGLIYGGLVLGITFGILSIIWLKRTRERLRIVTPFTLCVIFFTLFAASLSIRSFTMVNSYLSLMIVLAVSILSLIYFIYPKDFFVASTLSLLSGFGFYILYRMNNFIFLIHRSYVFAVTSAVLGALLIGILFYISGKGFASRFVKRRYNFNITRVGVIPSIISVAIAVCGLVVFRIFGPSVAYYMIFAMIACFGGFAIYYTVKLL